MESSLWNPFRNSSPANSTSTVHPFSSEAPPSQGLWNNPRPGNSVAARGAALWSNGHQQNELAHAQNHHFSHGQFGSYGSRPSHNYRPHDGQNFRHGHSNHPRDSFHNNRGRGQSFRGGRGRPSHFQNQKFGNTEQPQRFKPIFYCEVCECDFRTQAQLDEHIGKHIKCPRCEFVGVFDTIEEHFEMVHLSSSSSKVKPAETTEDLAKWRQERASKYPRVKSLSATTNAGNEKALPGPSTTGSDGDSRELSDGEIEDDVPSGKALTSLLSYYESESDGEPEEVTANRPSAKDDENLPMASAPQMSSSDEVDDTKFEVDTKPSAENIKPNLEAVNMVRPAISERVLRPSPSSFTKHFQPYFRQARRKPKTLYEKLVAKDLERDNDHLLQCFAHLYKNKFFDVKPAQQH